MNKTQLQTIEQVVENFKNEAPPIDQCEYVLSLRFSEEENARINELLEHNRQGVISQDELNELDRFLEAGTRLSILHSKARLSLKKSKISA